jgi:hypothetical protein
MGYANLTDLKQSELIISPIMQLESESKLIKTYTVLSSDQTSHVTSTYRVEINSFNEDSSTTESSEEFVEISGKGFSKILLIII